MPEAPGDSPLEQLLARSLTEAAPGLQERMAADPQAYLELVSLAASAHAGTARMLQDAVVSARTAGHSWAAVGKTLGLSKQAAQQKFGKGTAADLPADTRVVSPLTAFDEMAVLNRLGEYGWHSVGFGTLYHRVAQSDLQWEHRRVYAAEVFRGRLEKEGWERIGSMWFPWSYYARSTGLPALDGFAEEIFRAAGRGGP